MDKVTTTIAAATEMRAALLNSGTFGVEVVPGLDVDAGVGLDVEVPLDGSNITARLPMNPSVDPSLLIA